MEAAVFLWRVAAPAVKEGFLPDSISTDLHIGSMNAGMKDMLNVMDKFLAMEVSLEDVILRSAWNPAREIKHEELGHLSVGALANVTVLRVGERQLWVCGHVRCATAGDAKADLRTDASRRESGLRSERPDTPGLGQFAEGLPCRGRPALGSHQHRWPQAKTAIRTVADDLFV